MVQTMRRGCINLSLLSLNAQVEDQNWQEENLFNPEEIIEVIIFSPCLVDPTASLYLYLLVLNLKQKTLKREIIDENSFYHIIRHQNVSQFSICKTR